MPKKCDQGIGRNGSENKRIVAVFILSTLPLPNLSRNCTICNRSRRWNTGRTQEKSWSSDSRFRIVFCKRRDRDVVAYSMGSVQPNSRVCGRRFPFEVFERSQSKSSPLEKTRSKLANPVELNRFRPVIDGVLTGVASFNGDFLIGII